MKKFINALRKLLRDEEGVTAIEYALIASLIAIAIIVIVGLIGVQLNSIFQKICTALKGSPASACT